MFRAEPSHRHARRHKEADRLGILDARGSRMADVRQLLRLEERGRQEDMLFALPFRSGQVDRGRRCRDSLLLMDLVWILTRRSVGQGRWA